MGLAVSYTNEGYDSTAYRTLERWLSVKYPSIISPAELSTPADIGYSDRHNLHERVTNLFIQAAQLSPDGSEWIVNGAKKWITGAPYATHMTTAVRTGGKGMAGISLLVIPLESSGVEIERISNSGQKAGGASLIELRDSGESVKHLRFE